MSECIAAHFNFHQRPFSIVIVWDNGKVFSLSRNDKLSVCHLRVKGLCCVRLFKFTLGFGHFIDLE